MVQIIGKLFYIKRKCIDTIILNKLKCVVLERFINRIKYINQNKPYILEVICKRVSFRFYRLPHDELRETKQRTCFHIFRDRGTGKTQFFLLLSIYYVDNPSYWKCRKIRKHGLEKLLLNQFLYSSQITYAFLCPACFLDQCQKCLISMFISPPLCWMYVSFLSNTWHIALIKFACL